MLNVTYTCPQCDSRHDFSVTRVQDSFSVDGPEVCDICQFVFNFDALMTSILEQVPEQERGQQLDALYERALDRQLFASESTNFPNDPSY